MSLHFVNSIKYSTAFNLKGQIYIFSEQAAHVINDMQGLHPKYELKLQSYVAKPSTSQGAAEPKFSLSSSEQGHAFR